MMDPERWQWIQELFHQAAALSPEGRREFLAEACAADATAMAEVLSLLEEESRGDSMLDQSFAPSAGLLLDDHASGPRTVGPYRLVKLLGEGGMGVVYLAERDDLDSQVAIKILPDAWMSPARRGRFAVEQRTLSRLQHPSIARLYDAGTIEDGTPWFSMEYVEGVPITSFCVDHQLPVAEKLALFRQVCEAVQYAHQQAVLHRDLKPSNILVKADRTVRLLDFGIAKPLDRPGANLTQVGLAAATPAYAAPEQLRGEPSAITADVYSLGVILYELLTGSLPSSGRQAIADRDLEVLCQTATHAEPKRRYQTVEALLRDVANYLGSRPLEARPDGFAYRAGKFAKRNRGRLAAACLTAAIAAGTILQFTMRLKSARDEALAETARVQRIQEFLTHLFEGGGASAGPAEDLRVLTLVDRSARDVRTLRADPATQGDLYQTLGTVYQSLGKYGPASEMLEASLAVRRKLASPAPVSESLTALSMLRQDQGRLEEAERLATESMQNARQFLPPTHPALRGAISAAGRVQFDRGQYADSVHTLEQALAMIPESAEPAGERATTIERLSSAKFYQGRYDEAERLARDAMAIYRLMHGDQHPRVAGPLINLGALAHQRARYKEAEAFYREALEITRGYYGADHPENATAWNGIGLALTFQKRYPEAEEILKRVLRLREQIYGKVHPSVAATLSSVGNIAFVQGRLAEAEEHFRRMADVYRQLNGENHHFVALATSNIASVHMEKKDFAGAESIFRKALGIYAKSLPADHHDIGIGRVKLGRALMRQGRYGEAERESQAGLDILVKRTSEASPWVISARKDLTAIHEATKLAAVKR